MPSIRINKVIRDLNVGLPTLVDFLNKRGFDVEANPNAKISQQALKLCVEEFGKDWKKEQRQALIDKYLAPKESQNPSKSEAENKPTEAPKAPSVDHVKSVSSDEKSEAPLVTEPKVELKIKGHIDLDAKRPKSTPKKKETPKKEEVKPKVEAKKTETKSTQVTPKVDEKPKENEKPKVESRKPEETRKVTNETPKVEKGRENKPVKKEAPRNNVEKKPQEVKPQQGNKPEEKKPSAETEAKPAQAEEEDDVFRIHDSIPKMGIKVVGTVDLSAINPPSRSSKRLDEKKKRKRINRRKVDIEKAQSSISDDKSKGSEQDKGRSGRKREAAKPEKGRKVKRQQQLQAKPEVTQEDIQKQIKETLAQMENRKRRGANQAARYRKDKREAHRREQSEIERVQSEDRTVKLTEYVTANDLASMIDVPVTDIITLCFNLGMMVSINQRLEKETIDLILDEYGFEPEYVEAHVMDAIEMEEDREEDLLPRAPIVTVMGHVDHGKTSLLDAIRNTNVISGEAGGITQHVGAYSVELENGRKITFLDTPGHEAFTAMRARGAKVTDIVIVVVAADDGVMPQTKEAINHASLAGVPIIFAINKVDKPQANPDKIKEELSNLNYLVEDWGGKYQSQNISAKKNIGIHELLEKVLLEADFLELKANPDKRATGAVLESTMEVGRGYTTKVLIQEGTLKVGDYILAGTYYGRVKALFNERGQNIDSVGPSDPVIVLGLNGAAQAGETFNVLETEQEVRDIAGKRTQLKREQKERMQRVPTLESIGQRIAEGNVKELNVIVKGDVDGSVEALSDSIEKLSTEEVRVKVIHKAVGQISDSDVMLAAASGAVIIGFQVRPAASARKLAENEGVEIRTYSIIYDALDDVKSAMEGMLSPEIKEVETANLEVLETFKITKVGTIAGCMVKSGKISRTDKVRLIRDGIVKYDGVLGSLKRFKDDAKEVVAGLECGLNIENFNDVQVGDVIEAYQEIKVKKKL